MKIKTTIKNSYNFYYFANFNGDKIERISETTRSLVELFRNRGFNAHLSKNIDEYLNALHNYCETDERSMQIIASNIRITDKQKEEFNTTGQEVGKFPTLYKLPDWYFKNVLEQYIESVK